jgi:hypothetical protein
MADATFFRNYFPAIRPGGRLANSRCGQDRRLPGPECCCLTQQSLEARLSEMVVRGKRRADAGRVARPLGNTAKSTAGLVARFGRPVQTALTRPYPSLANCTDRRSCAVRAVWTIRNSAILL